MVDKSKRQRLAEIVSGLGPEATPAQIREEAYRVGFGAVSGQQLCFVRNSLWPDRKRRTDGLRLDGKDRPPKPTMSLVPCPLCGSSRTSVTDKRPCTDPGSCVRHRKCNDCGHKFSRIEPSALLYGKQVCHERWAALTEKPCTYCKRTLPIDSFSFQSGSDVIRRPGCKECSAENRAGYIGRDIQKRYGITLDDYHAMLASQGGRCAICGTDSPFGRLDNSARKRKRRTFSVDHCHATGKVRGLLCARCNLAIGNFGDDTQVMRAAVAYIESRGQAADPSATMPPPE